MSGRKTTAKNRVAISYAQLKRLNVSGSLAAKEYPRLDRQVCIKVHHLRHTLLDHGNLNAKAAIDALRYGGLLRDDSPEYVESESHSQEKISREEEEKTIIEIFEA